MPRSSRRPSACAGRSSATSSAAAGSTTPRPSCRSGLSLVNELTFLSAGRHAACSARCRAAPTPTSSAWSSASSAPRCWTSAASTALGDQVALEALVRMTDEEIKHQELFRRLEAMMAADMPAGYVQTADPNAVARGRAGQEHLGGAGADAATSSCSRRRTTAPASSRERRPRPSCGRTCSCSTGRRSRSTRSSTSSSSSAKTPSWTPAERDAAVDDLIALVGAVDGILQAQAEADARYFIASRGTPFTDAQREQIHDESAEGLPLAIHRVGRHGAALPEGAVRR